MKKLEYIIKTGKLPPQRAPSSGSPFANNNGDYLAAKHQS